MVEFLVNEPKAASTTIAMVLALCPAAFSRKLLDALRSFRCLDGFGKAVVTGLKAVLYGLFIVQFVLLQFLFLLGAIVLLLGAKVVPVQVQWETGPRRQRPRCDSLVAAFEFACPFSFVHLAITFWVVLIFRLLLGLGGPFSGRLGIRRRFAGVRPVFPILAIAEAGVQHGQFAEQAVAWVLLAAIGGLVRFTVFFANFFAKRIVEQVGAFQSLDDFLQGVEPQGSKFLELGVEIQERLHDALVPDQGRVGDAVEAFDDALHHVGQGFNIVVVLVLEHLFYFAEKDLDGSDGLVGIFANLFNNNY